MDKTEKYILDFVELFTKQFETKDMVEDKDIIESTAKEIDRIIKSYKLSIKDFEKSIDIIKDKSLCYNIIEDIECYKDNIKSLKKLKKYIISPLK